ncbi:MAG: hypothetical protein AABX37_02070 [Nanoarchaeota archaeon]
MRYALLPVVIGLLLLAPVMAAEDLKATLQAHLATVEKDLEGKKIPGIAGTLFGDQRINIYITFNSREKEIISIITEDKIVQSVELVKLKDPTLSVSIKEDVLRGIQESENPLQELKSALEEGKIKYKAYGFFNKIKFSTVSVFTKLIDTFSGSDEVAEEEELEEEDEFAEEEAAPVAEPETPQAAPEPEAAAPAPAAEPAEEESAPLTGSVVAALPTPVSKNHTITLVGAGFPVTELTIKVGDTITWVDAREGKTSQAMIVGSSKCPKIKSKIYHPGESFSWTFDKKGNCMIVDGIYSTQTMNVIVG